MSIVAVITGDIVHSSKMDRKQRDYLLSQLKIIFRDLEKHSQAADIYRGDSFQMLLPRAEEALLVAMILRAGLRKLTKRDENQTDYIDARISVGVGEVSYTGQSLGTSDGAAFRLSGRGLDEMKRRERLKVSTLWPKINEEMEVSCALSEAIVSRWTHAQASIIYSYLRSQKTQQELAKEFGITQGAVSQRLSESGNIDAINKFLKRFAKLVRSQI